MAAKIGLVLALDGEKEFTAAMRNANKESKLLKAELKNITSAFDGEANSMKALTAKQQALTKQQEAYQRKVDAAKAGLENAKDAYNKQADALESLRKQLDEARQAQQRLEDSGDKSSDVYRDQAKQVEELEAAVKQQSQQLMTASGRVTDWNTQLTKSEGELRDCNSALEKNEQYLREASTAADGCATSIDEMGKEAKEAAEETDKMSISLGDMVKAKAVDLAGDALMALKDKAIDAAKAIVEIGSNFEAQMSKVGAISGASSSDMDALVAKAREMGSTTKFTATEAGEALEYMAMAGWKTNDMIDGLDGIMYLAAASGEDLGTTSDIVTDALTAFGMEAKDSGHFADILATASSNANTNVSMMGETFKYVAPVAGSMGIEAEDAAEAIGLMANAGIKSSQAGTSLRSILTRLATDAGASSTSLGALGTLTKELGVEFYNTDGSVRDLSDVLGEARVAWSGLTEEQQSNYGKTIAGQNALSGWLALMNAAPEDVEKLQSALENCDGAAENMANTMNDNLLGDVAIFQSAAQELGLSVYDHIKGPLRDIVQTATSAITGITDAINPQKTALEQFITDIKAANDEIAQSIDAAESSMAKGEADVAKIDSLAQIILDADEAFGIFIETDTSPVATNVDETTSAVKESLFGENEALATAGEAVTDFAGADTSGLSENVGTTASDVEKSLSGIDDATGTTKENLEGVADVSPDATGKFDGIVDEVGKVDTAASEANTALGDVGSEDPQSVTGKYNSITDEVGTVTDSASAANEGLGQVGDIEPVPASGAFEELKGELQDLGTATEAAGRQMDSFTKYKVSAAIAELAKEIPELDGAWDELNGTLSLTEEQFNKLINAQKRLILSESLEKAKASATEAWTQAMLNNQMAQDAVAESLKEINAAAGTNIKSMQELFNAYGTGTAVGEKLDKVNFNLIKTASEADDAFKEAAEAYAASNAEMEKVDHAADELSKTLGLVSDEVEETGESTEQATVNLKELSDQARNGEVSIEDYRQALEDAGLTADEIDEAVEGLGDSMGEMSDEAQAAAEEVQKAYDDIRDSIQKNIESAAESFEKFDRAAHETLTAQSMAEALESQIEAVETWQKNMETLAGKIGDGMSQELYDTLASQGPEQSYDAVQALADALEKDGESFKAVVENWGTLLDLSDAVGDSVAGATDAGKQLAEALGEGFEESDDFTESVETAVSNAAEAASEKAEEFKAAGEAAAEATGAGVSAQESSVKTAAETAVKNAATAAKNKASEFKPAGEAAGKKYAEGLKSQESTIRTTAENIASTAATVASNRSGNFQSAGNAAGGSFVQGISAYYGSANSAGATLASNAQSGAGGHSLYQTGFGLASGFASGINAGAYLAINAAANMAAKAVQAAKDKAEVNSPSKLMAREVGKPLSEGLADGIKQGENLVTGAAKDVADASAKAFKAAYKGSFVTDAKGFLEELKLVHNMSKLEEAEYWKAMAAAAKKGSEEYTKYSKLAAEASSETSTISDSKLQSKIGSNFGISKTKTTGSGKNKKEVKKSSEDYWAEVVRAAKQHISNMQIVYDISAEQEAAYWAKIVSKTKKGTQAYYDALSYQKTAEKNAQSEREKLQDDILRAHQNYVDTQIATNKMSVSDAIAYWKEILKTYEKGTAGYRTVQEAIKTLREQAKQERKEAKEKEIEERKQANEKILTDAEQYLERYKVFHSMSTLEEIDYWTGIVKTLKKGSDEWWTAQEHIKTLREQAKNEEAQANADRLSQYETDLERRKLLHDFSVEEEIAYWEKIQKEFGKGTDEWWTVEGKLKDLRNEASNKEEETQADRLAHYEKFLNHQKILYTMSTQEEITYWKTVLKEFKKGSDEWFTVKETIKNLRTQAANEESQAAAEEAQKQSKLLAKYEKAVDKRKTLQGMSISDELKYWKKRLKKFEEGSDEYLTVYKKIQNLEEQKEAEIAQKRADRLNEYKDTLEKRKILENVSLAEEIQYWQARLKKFAEGTDEWYDIMSTLKSLEEQQADVIKNENAEKLRSWEDYVNKKNILGEMDLQTELSYWRDRLKEVTKYSDEWYSIYDKIQSLQEQRASANLSKANTLLSNYKTYWKLSAKGEIQYWDTVRRQFAVGTKERIEADQNYFDARENYYSQLKDLDDDYAESQKSIKEKMLSDIDELNRAYKDAVNARKSEILSSMNLFEAWDSTGYTGDTLLRNLKTQVSGLALWEQQLEELSKRGLSEELMDELRQMGPDAAANIYSLNQMTDKELTEYQKLWEQKNALAMSQAVKENESFRQETNSQIAQIRKDAQQQLADLNAEYKAGVAEINKGMTTELANLAKTVTQIGEDAIGGLVAGLKNQASAQATKSATQEVVKTVSGGLSNLSAEGKVIGTKTLDGILSGLMDTKKIETASASAVESIKRAMQGAAQIHSPSQLFKDEVGEQIGAGIAEGMSGTGSLEAVRQSVKDMLDAVKKEVSVESTIGIGGIDFAGISQMQRLTAQVVAQSPIVNVNNDGSNGLLIAILGSMTKLQATMDAGITLDDGTIIGRYQPAFSKESANVTVRRNRGRL